jgi:hypothetical protein
MKRTPILLLVLFLVLPFLSLPAQAQTASNPRLIPTAVLWDYDFTKPNNKPCTTATQASCVFSFTVSTSNVSDLTKPPVPVGTPITLSVLTMPAANTTGPTVGISVPYVAPTAFGWYMITVTVRFNDASGVTQAGPNIGVSYYVGPDGVLNLRTTP